MTEAQWRTCNDLGKMLDCLKAQHRATTTKAGRRKLRLFVCACCRQVWSLLHSSSRLALECAENYADGLVGKDELKRAERASQAAMKATNGYLAWSATRGVREATQSNVSAALTATYWTWGALVRDPKTPGAVLQPQGKLAEESQRLLLRDIFGNPFRSVVIDPAWPTWNDRTVPKLAQAIYDDRELPSGHLDAGQLAVLADALEDAGCTSQDILGHCRSSGPHVLGCWPVDLLMGKA